MRLPPQFVELTRQQLSADEAERLCLALQEEPVVSARLNPLKTDARLSLPRVPWCDGAYYLPSRPPFTFDPLLHAGVYYVQEASSMYLSEVVRQYLPQESLLALDLCAAPGGKTTLLLSRLPEGSLLVSNEPEPRRAAVLQENVAKWGSPSCVVTQNKPDDFALLPSAFDFILTDVPCSGEGMFRKEPQALAQWSLEGVALCQRRQRGILSGVWPALKPGGLLVYSTCTFNRLECEDNTRWIARELGAELLFERHFYPHAFRGEGFFIAALRKRGEPQASALPAAKPEPLPMLCGDFSLQTFPKSRAALPSKYAAFIQRLCRKLRVLSCGVPLAELRGKDWLPSPSLALSAAYVRGTYREVELSYAEALSYLRREALRLDCPGGIVLLTFRRHPLGFAKSVGGRANNLYPREWRILTTHAPSSPFTLLPA
ncbi:MAG: rRNA cytosine-C5-methyltransferase [Prevotellaceae bacterium]|nr:rRNA cytosine-C5-methyltransferase [Prevotellaceae bacterium]